MMWLGLLWSFFVLVLVLCGKGFEDFAQKRTSFEPLDL